MAIHRGDSTMQVSNTIFLATMVWASAIVQAHAQKNDKAETPTCKGTITSFPLPANRLAPYSSLRGSKHTNMATDGRRLYVTGGDWLHSATDGTWSVNLAGR